MKEIANLTDFLLALESALFAFLLWKGGKGQLWTFMFVSLSVASFAGGITHTFYDEAGTVEHLVWWDATLLALGTASIFLFSMAVGVWTWHPQSEASPTFPLKGKRLAVACAIFAVYAAYVLSGLRSFLTAIIMYLPASIFLFAAIIRQSTAKEIDFKSTSICGILGMALTFIAAGMQQAKVEIPALMLNYNALYHIVQAIGLFLLFGYGARILSPGNKS